MTTSTAKNDQGVPETNNNGGNTERQKMRLVCALLGQIQTSHLLPTLKNGVTRLGMLPLEIRRALHALSFRHSPCAYFVSTVSLVLSLCLKLFSSRNSVGVQNRKCTASWLPVLSA